MNYHLSYQTSLCNMGTWVMYVGDDGTPRGVDFLTSMEPPNESLFRSIEANDAETFFAMNEDDSKQNKQTRFRGSGHSIKHHQE